MLRKPLKGDCIETEPQRMRVIFGHDGSEEAMETPGSLQNAFIAHIKQMAELNTDQYDLPQCGHFRLKFQDRHADVTVSTAPSSLGERLTLQFSF